MKSSLEEWCRLIRAPKNIFGWPSWTDIEVHRETRKDAVEAGRTPLHSNLALRSQLIVNLGDKNDIAIEDIRLRLAVWKNRPMEDITATFEIYHEDRWICASRIDYMPISPHPNRHWRKFALEPEINGSHIHGCEDNCRIGHDAFAPIGNLPNARALENEPQSFRDICKSVEEHFVVNGFCDMPAPEWNRSLLL